MKKFPYEIKEYVNNGAFSIVFKVDYNGKDVAFKLRYLSFDKDEEFDFQKDYKSKHLGQLQNYFETSYRKREFYNRICFAKRNALKEYRLLKLFGDIPAIPNPLKLLFSYDGNFSYFDINKFYPFKDNILNHEIKKTNVFLVGGFLMDYVQADWETKLFSMNEEMLCGTYDDFPKMPKSFFDNLEDIVYKLHKKGYALPGDCSLMAKDNKPYIIDFDDITELRPEKLKEDYSLLKYLREKYQI